MSEHTLQLGRRQRFQSYMLQARARWSELPDPHQKDILSTALLRLGYLHVLSGEFRVIVREEKNLRVIGDLFQKLGMLQNIAIEFDPKEVVLSEDVLSSHLTPILDVYHAR